MNETLKLGISLMLVTLIASAALALTNYYTIPVIERQKASALKESLNKVMAADSFKEKEDYYEAYGKDGEIIGKALKIQSQGYSSVINALVGIDLQGKIIGIDIISQQETPGLGTRVTGELFLQQFIGKTKDELSIKKDGGKIDAITGATISSRALTEGIKNALGGGIPVKDYLNKVIKAKSFKEKDGYYEAYDSKGILVGKVFMMEEQGKLSVIKALVGIDMENRVTGIAITSQQELPGKGANITKESFLSQFVGKTADELKLKKESGAIDAITGASVSSKAVVKGVRKAIEKSLGKDAAESTETGKGAEKDGDERKSGKTKNENDEKKEKKAKKAKDEDDDKDENEDDEEGDENEDDEDESDDEDEDEDD